MARQDGERKTPPSGAEPGVLRSVGRWWFGAALFVVALLPRLFAAIAWTREPVWDGHYYDFGARRIAAGWGYSDQLVIDGVPTWHAWCHYPVGYPALLSVAYRIFGPGQYVAPLLNAVAGALMAVVVYRLARYATGEPRARIAGLLVALWPGLIVYAALLMTEPVAALFLLCAAWAAARHRGSGWASASAGILLGLGTLVRPQSILLAPAVGLFALGARGHDRPTARRRALRSSAIATAAALLVVSPWTIRNCLVMDGCAFVSTNAGWNLAIGSFPKATGRFETLRARDRCRVVTGQVQQDRCWLGAGIDWIRADPGRWLALMPRKLALTFDHESFAMGYLGEADPRTWPPERQARGRELLSGLHLALLTVAALGLVARPAGRLRLWQHLALSGVLLWAVYAADQPTHPFWPLALAIPAIAALRLPDRPRVDGVVGYLAVTIATVCATHAVFFGEDRYHIVLSPMLCLLAACALRRPAERPVA